MNMSQKTWLAIALWVLVGALAGAVLAVVFQGAARHIVFGVIAGAGVVGLLAVQLVAWPTPPKPVVSPTPTLLWESSLSAVPKVDKRATTESLSPEAARQWLDDFLVKQQ